MELSRSPALPFLICTAALACAPAPTATVTVALSTEIPESVSTVSVSVLEIDRGTVVTSATTAAPNASFTLGVPAETPLEFRVVARTNRPGPIAVGAMPAYFGSTVRTIALGREQEIVALTVHRAGVLTVARQDDDPDLAREPINVRLEAENSAVRPFSFTIDPESRVRERVFVLRTGRYRAVAVEPEGEEEGAPVIVGGRGLLVGRELESVAILHVARMDPPLSVHSPASLRLAFLDATDRPLPRGDAVETSPDAPVAIRVRVEALDGTGAEVQARADVRVVLAGDPRGVVAGLSVGEAGQLPSMISGFAVLGTGRFRARATARLEDGRLIRGEMAANAMASDVVPGPPVRMLLEIEDLAHIGEGTVLAIDVLDGRGLFATDASGVVHFSESDPWMFFPDGPSRQITALDRGHIRLAVARPSGPRGLPVVLRATLTATTAPTALTSSVVLPLLEIDR